MRNEALELPEERYMGNKPKTATSKYIDKIEELEQSQFKRVSMSKKEIRKLKNQQQNEIQDNFDRLDDDYAAIDTILRRAQGREQDDDLREGGSKTKFAKSLKKAASNKKRDVKASRK